MKRTCNDPLGTGCQTVLSRYNPDTTCRACADRYVPPPSPKQVGRVQPQVWPPEAIIAALQTWAGEFGRTPTRDEWIKSGRKPHHSTISKRMGSWSKAIIAAGFEPRAANRPVLPRPGQREAVLAALVEGPLTVADTMRVIGSRRRDVAHLILDRLEAEGVARCYYDHLGVDGRRVNMRWFLMEQAAA